MNYDDIVGLEPNDPRTNRFYEQLAGVEQRRPIVPAGLAVYAMLPPPERLTNLRTRMAAEIARAMSANGNVTHDDLIAAGFSGAEIAEHFTAARRAARVDRMVV